MYMFVQTYMYSAVHVCTYCTSNTHRVTLCIDSMPDPPMCHGPVIILNIIILDMTSHTRHVKVLHFLPLRTGGMLKANDSLQQLGLRGCELQPKGLEEVIKGVQVNTKLETLDLSRNTIDNKRASCLGKSDMQM